MSNSKNKSYRISLCTLEEHGHRGECFSEIIYCAFIRSPTYITSFCDLVINITPIFAKQLISDINQNTLNVFNLSIKILKQEDLDDDNPDYLDDEIYSRYFYITECLPVKIVKLSDRNHVYESTNINMVDHNCLVRLQLCNPALYSLRTKNQFNFRLRDKTAIQAIKTFEDRINEKFGDIFERNDLTHEPSEHVYEEILGTVDFSCKIPRYIIENKKPLLMPFSFYIFDDFCLDPKFNKPIINHFISPTNIEDFERFNITEYIDPLYTTKVTKISNLNDIVQSNLNQHYCFQSNFCIGDNHLDEEGKTKTGYKLPQEMIQYESKEEISLDGEGGRNVRNISTTGIDSKEIEENMKTMSIQITDTRKLELKRIENYISTINSKIKYLVDYQTSNCSPDFMQFGRKYNMDISRADMYLYTPYSIYNIFYKVSTTGELSHLIEYKMFEMYDDDIVLCKDCVNNSGMYCLHWQKGITDDMHCVIGSS